MIRQLLMILGRRVCGQHRPFVIFFSEVDSSHTLPLERRKKLNLFLGFSSILLPTDPELAVQVVRRPPVNP